MSENRIVETGDIKNKHDELFKQLLEVFFVEFVELFFPQVNKLMDKRYLNFLKQEVITDVLDMEKHIIDILVETKLADEEGLVLIHVEGQAQRLPDYNRKSSLLTAFIETYVKLTEDEEVLYRDRIKQELTQQEVEKLLEISTSYHEKGKEEGIKIGEEKVKAEVAKKMLAKNLSIDEIVEITELTKEQVEKVKIQGK